MNKNSWAKAAHSRVGRRRLLLTSGGSATAALLLAACGKGDGGGDSGGSSGLVVQPEDTTKQATRGGTIRDRHNADASTLDIANPVAPLNRPAQQAYSTLVRQKPGFLSPSKLDLEGDLAESWEWSNDGLQITMKLRPNVKWHNKSPVNARMLDVDDVVFSWSRYASKAALRPLFANAVNPDAPVISVTAPDSRTIVVKLKEPLVYAPEIFASYGSFSGNVIIVPKETDSTFDIRREMIGTGPFVLGDYTPSLAFTMKRNPEYYNKDFAYVDQVDLPIVTEYAAVLSQLKAGNIHYFLPRAADVLSIKREEPRLLIYENEYTPEVESISFGWLPEGKSPFLDERVRQAVSMSWNRDVWIDAFFNVASFRSEGLPTETRWNSAISSVWEGWWLDPQGNDFGPNAKYYRNDIAEAKKLLAAAGYPNGLDTISTYIKGPERDHQKLAETLDGMTADAGFRVTVNAADYAKEYIPSYRDGSGQYQGWVYHTVTGAIPTRISPVSAMAAEFWSKSGTTFKGFSTSGKNDRSGDAQLDSLLAKARVELDTERRRTLVYDIQRYLGGKIYGLIAPGGAAGFTLAWPALRNFRTWQGHAALTYYGLWLDDTKPPFKNG
jgi:peptide/nickel transport system substrate-binding protein